VFAGNADVFNNARDILKDCGWPGKNFRKKECLERLREAADGYEGYCEVDDELIAMEEMTI
jgi:hypothetical protein